MGSSRDVWKYGGKLGQDLIRIPRGVKYDKVNRASICLQRRGAYNNFSCVNDFPFATKQYSDNECKRKSKNNNNNHNHYIVIVMLICWESFTEGFCGKLPICSMKLICAIIQSIFKQKLGEIIKTIFALVFLS